MTKPSRAEKLEQKRRFWRKHIQDMHDSGLTQAEYCRQNNLNRRHVWYWKKELSAQNTPVVVEVPLHRIPDPGQCLPPRPIRLTVNGRYLFEIEKGFDPFTLHQTLQVLEAL